MSESVEPSVAVIVVAAGLGTRLGERIPKAFVDVAGTSVLARALHSVFGMAVTPQVVVVAPGPSLALAETIAWQVAGEKADYVDLVAGGETRQGSVASGITVLRPSVGIVLVHDAARPLTPSSLFDEIAAEVERRGHGVIPGLPVSDTIKRVDDAGGILETIDRSELAAVQTPQGFPREHLERAYEAVTREHTDDAAVVISAGYSVSVTSGDPRAFKITTPTDRQKAIDAVVSNTGVPRIGFGTDTHAFDDAVPLWLAALHWPGEPGLAGHSDGDAISHAIVDALLAAAGLGDIGAVFGTSDPRFRNAHGDVFLRETRAMLEATGFRIGNVSVQLVGNWPRFARRREEAQTLLASLLGAQVSISATTTDGLGFTGRGEGLAALATALIFSPNS